jgi:hypothetical protein
MRVVGLVSRTFAEIAYVKDGQLRPGGRVALLVAELTQWAATTLRATDHVVLEATGNTTAVVRAVRAHVGRVVVANPSQVRLVADARATAPLVAQARRELTTAYGLAEPIRGFSPAVARVGGDAE